ncbi:MAG: hypothetical protein LBT14_12100 [Treponema sp.]|jgi:hypothetical protein|nr:hypothetical protein [Treponema sp.]
MELQDRDFQGPVFSRQSLITPLRDSNIHSRLEGMLMEIFEEYQKKAAGYRRCYKGLALSSAMK